MPSKLLGGSVAKMQGLRTAVLKFQPSVLLSDLTLQLRRTETTFGLDHSLQHLSHLSDQSEKSEGLDKKR